MLSYVLLLSNYINKYCIFSKTCYKFTSLQDPKWNVPTDTRTSQVRAYAMLFLLIVGNKENV
jgi:hypothetical protein